MPTKKIQIVDRLGYSSVSSNLRISFERKNNEYADEYHKAYVKDAIGTGLSVPEALKDYPELLGSGENLQIKAANKIVKIRKLPTYAPAKTKKNDQHTVVTTFTTISKKKHTFIIIKQQARGLTTKDLLRPVFLRKFSYICVIRKRIGSSDGELTHISVPLAYRGKGHASFLLNGLAVWMQRTNCRKLVVDNANYKFWRAVKKSFANKFTIKNTSSYYGNMFIILK